jgi:DNA polymerase-4
MPPSNSGITRSTGANRLRIREATGLTASAGVSVNKFLAKVASDYRKPDGLFVVLPSDAEKFAEELKIEQFWGVGKVTAEKMHRLGIHTGRDLKKYDEAALIRHFGKIGRVYYLNARGVDEREVEGSRIRKSLGAENTFMIDLCDEAELKEKLWSIAKEVWERLSRHAFTGRTVTLKIKYADFRETSKRKTLAKSIKKFETFWAVSKGLLASVDFGENKKIRLTGLTVGNAKETDSTGYRQLELDFGDEEDYLICTNTGKG